MVQKRVVLVFYVGGTIGMQPNEKGALVPVPRALVNKIREDPDMNDVTLAKNGNSFGTNLFALPPIIDDKKIYYSIIEYDNLLDSSNVTPSDWIKIAKDIERHYDEADGFVIIHGTDTMAYTSSILSYMLEDLQKPVVITGAQIPIFQSRNDAKNNVLGALIFAGCFNIPEVCVFFGNKLLRGNRTTKIDADGWESFTTPKFQILGEAGVKYTVHKKYLEPVNKPLKVHTAINPNVSIIYFSPTITTRMIKSSLEPPVAGIVIVTFGNGNIPSLKKDIVELLKDAIRRNILIVNVTQCSRGTATAAYATGKVLYEIGVVTGKDMTVEAAHTKLTYVLGLPGLTYSERVEMMNTNIRGEMGIK